MCFELSIIILNNSGQNILSHFFGVGLGPVICCDQWKVHRSNSVAITAQASRSMT